MAQARANPELKLETTTTSDEAIIRCIGKLTYRSAEMLQSVLYPFPETKRLVLDLKDLAYLDSFGLGVLVSVYLSAREQGCQLRLNNVNQQVQQVIRITNLGYLIESITLEILASAADSTSTGQRLLACPVSILSAEPVTYCNARHSSWRDPMFAQVDIKERNGEP